MKSGLDAMPLFLLDDLLSSSISNVFTNSQIFTGYIGSALGGYTYDIMGFENSTLVVIAMQILALMAIFGLICSPKTTRPASDDGEKQTLLQPNCQKSDRNANYHSFEVLV